MYENILVPLDQSRLAEEAIQPAIDLAKALNSKISLIYVFELLPLLAKDKEIEYAVLKERGEKYLTQIRQKIEESGISSEIVIKTGDPGLVICQYAGTQDIDLIIMSAHGHGNIERWALGSVSDKVLRHSPKPVLLVREVSMDILTGRNILVVDDEPDILETVAEELDICVTHKARDFDTALEYLQNNKYDIVILDIMGVDGFELLKHTVSRGIPTLMLTAHALTPEALAESAKLGAVSYLPKEKMTELRNILADIIHGRGRPVWEKLFDRLAPYFRKRFGWSPKEEQDIIKEFEDIVKKQMGFT